MSEYLGLIDASGFAVGQIVGGSLLISSRLSMASMQWAFKAMSRQKSLSDCELNI